MVLIREVMASDRSSRLTNRDTYDLNILDRTGQSPSFFWLMSHYVLSHMLVNHNAAASALSKTTRTASA